MSTYHSNWRSSCPWCIAWLSLSLRKSSTLGNQVLSLKKPCHAISWWFWVKHHLLRSFFVAFEVIWMAQFKGVIRWLAFEVVTLWAYESIKRPRSLVVALISGCHDLFSMVRHMLMGGIPQRTSPGRCPYPWWWIQPRKFPLYLAINTQVAVHQEL